MTSVRPSKLRKTSSSHIRESVNNFMLLPVTIPSQLPSVPSAIHIIYLRRHEEPPRPPAITPTPSPRTIFVVNIPIDSTKEALRGLFASLGGRLEDVRFHEENVQHDNENLALPEIWDRRLHPSGGTAHITFPTSEDVEKIFRTISKERQRHNGAIREWGVGVDNPTISLGLQRTLIRSKANSGYVTNYKLQYPDKAELQALVDTALARFNAAESARMLSLKRLRSVPDEDGFITVTRRNRDDVTHVQKKNKAANLEDFYRFQKREKREKKLEELRRKFEEDKIKVERAKEARKFKPF